MKNYAKLLTLAALLAVPAAQAAFHAQSAAQVVRQIGSAQEAKKLYVSAVKELKQAQSKVARLNKQINKAKAECPASSLNPFRKSFKAACAQKTAKLALDEAKLGFEKGKQVWNNDLVQKLRALIQKSYPVIKKQLGL